MNNETDMAQAHGTPGTGESDGNFNKQSYCQDTTRARAEKQSRIQERSQNTSASIIQLFSTQGFENSFFGFTGSICLTWVNPYSVTDEFVQHDFAQHDEAVIRGS